ncbi:hypothetical protein JCM11491_003986 [Sporobolomyces phaffii]
MFKPQDLSDSDLVDHLCVAVEERDVQFVVLWSRMMNKRNLAGGALAKHSWKAVSALELASSREWAVNREIILQVLLHGCDDYFGTQAFSDETKHAKGWAKECIEHWTTTRKAQASDARDLLEMRSDKAAQWIKANLPPHPRPESLTGFSSLPSRPSTPSPPPSISPEVPSTPESVPPLRSTRPAVTPRPILKKHPSRYSSIEHARTPTPLPPVPTVLRDAKGVPIFRPSENCRLAIYRLPLSGARSLLASSGVKFTNLVVSSSDQDSVAYLTVSSKAEMAALVAWGDSLGYFVQRSPPSNPGPSNLFHLVVRGLPRETDLATFKNLVRVTRCGGFDFRLGFLDEEFVGTVRVATEAGAKEAVQALNAKSRSAIDLKVTCGSGSGPANLVPLAEPPRGCSTSPKVVDAKSHSSTVDRSKRPLPEQFDDDDNDGAKRGGSIASRDGGPYPRDPRRRRIATSPARLPASTADSPFRRASPAVQRRTVFNARTSARSAFSSSTLSPPPRVPFPLPPLPKTDRPRVPLFLPSADLVELPSLPTTVAPRDVNDHASISARDPEGEPRASSPFFF